MRNAKDASIQPITKFFTTSLPHQNLIQFDLETQRSHLTRKCSETGEIKVDPTTIIIHLANRDKFWPMAISSWALYLGPDSSYNKSSVMVWPDLVSEGETEYTDFERALDELYDCLDPAIRQVIIATDSSSLVQLCTKDIPELARDKDFRRNNPMEFPIIWEGLNPNQLGYPSVGPLAFRFWLVPKELNQEAQKMAEYLIDREVQMLEAESKAEFADNMRRKRRGTFGSGFNY
ncbi:uncharacterized protein FFB20_07587 [Fusarium fujikuroi]|uniref:RNase H type-1 domain-containing protein n=2 Tax=Fusarium fujikuroi TaxID=5127 RepID=S0E5I4_GIBF5|nr:uncharacterized protein FFUJ_14611 [Fusarium fujikuroi IMI 58289]KLO93835.1 uncharacterized protein Y057_14421 [Fusarium fujikuroi]KLP21955.1 uncharacterized protein LW94_14166 [Fusarium fujikuroi]QGI63656.1 hypothetical protein CEK27_007627 [Fusarium fujikuroi]QGI80927.1 hypothetical protein CEK25_007656 [Fusarium fujikuroi]QGI94538.1 hypothetical protein CEK26_007607 [Fusarium fujikuroi]